MATNTLTSGRKQHYLKQFEVKLHDRLIMNDVANDVSSQFPDGLTFNMPQLANMQVGNYTGTLTVKNVTTQNSTLTMDKKPYVTFNYDDTDKKLDSWDIISQAGNDAIYKIKQQMEGDFFSQYGSARYRNSTPSAVLTTSTAYSTFSQAVATLINAGVPEDEICIIGDAYDYDIIAQQAISSTFSLSDSSFQRGYVGAKLAGAMLYRNQNLTNTYILDIATQPTAGDTLTINGLTFTFVAAIGSTAGNILIETDANTTVSYLIEAINAAATGVPGANVGVKYVAFSDDNADFLTGMTASDGTNQMLMTSKHGYRVVSSSMTNASNDWQAVYEHALVMGKNAFTVAYRAGIQSKVVPIYNSLVDQYTNWLFWGQTVSVEGAKRAYEVVVMKQAAEA